MKIIIGSDHGGFELKNVIDEHLVKKGYSVEDLGCGSNKSCDYTGFGKAVAKKCVEEKLLGILICGTGIGISITANKVPGARCAPCTNTTLARLAREHNDANILALGGRIIGTEVALDIVDTFLTTQFSREERHIRRISQIEENE